MNKPRLLDICCAGGGCTRGYQKAGFYVVGVDIQDQPDYCGDEFFKADGLKFVEEHGEDFDFIHVSPPCQGYSTATRNNSPWVSYSQGKDTPRLIAPFREALIKTGKPYVIENVRGAKSHLINPVELCGSMFNLFIPRHRYFETSFELEQPHHPKCSGMAKRNSEILGFEYRDMSVTGKGRYKGTSERWKILMGIDWNMSQSNLAEAIPPAYTEWIGKQFLNIMKY